MDLTFAVIAACILVGLSKGGLIGPVGGTLALPLLVQATYNDTPITVKGATGVLLVMLMIGDVFAVPVYWKKWDTRYLWLTVPASVVGVLLGTVVLVSLDSTTARHVLGIATLLIIAYKVFNVALVRYLRSAAYQHRNWHGYVAGLSSGIGSALANSGGPPMTAYMLLQRLEPSAFVGTLAVFFLIVNWLKVPGYLVSGVFDDMQMMAGLWWTLLLIPVAVLGCRPIIRRVNKDIFDWFITALLLWAALSLLK